MTIGEQIKARRRELGWTQLQLADRVGISMAAISVIEVGKRQPRDRTVQKISGALAMALDASANGAPRRPPTAEPDAATGTGNPTGRLEMGLARAEIRAMHSIVAVLKDLPAESTRRIVDWLREVVNQ